MPKRKFNVSIHNAIAVTVSIACVLIMFSHLFSGSVKANSENNFVFDLSAFTDHCDHPYSGENDKSENEDTPYCTEPCNLGSCCIVMGLSSTSDATNSNGLTTSNYKLDEQFNTEDILGFIFKPPKI